jgi:hypothetical protein
MALKIIPEVTAPGELKKEGCYINLLLHMDCPNPIIPVDRYIWASKEDYDTNPKNPSIMALIEIESYYRLDMENAGDVYQGKNIAYKMIMWAHQDIKSQILAANPKWSDADIEIVDVPKT